MEFIIEEDITECQKLWEKYSPKRHLFDLWEYRYPFYEAYKYDPYFIVGSKKGNILGIIPLWFEEKDDFYTFFGGTFPEPNSFFIKEKYLFPEFLKQCPANTHLFYISEKESNFYNFSASDPSYYLDIAKLDNNYENLFSAFSKKHKKNLKYDLKQVQKSGYELIKNNPDDLSLLVAFNKKRFGKDSDFTDNQMIVGIDKLIKVALKQNRLSMISIKIENQIQAVGVSVVYNQCYYALCSGRSLEVENIGKLLISEQIKDALNQKLKKLDFLTTDSGWKHLWNLEEDKLYEYHS